MLHTHHFTHVDKVRHLWSNWKNAYIEKRISGVEASNNNLTCTIFYARCQEPIITIEGNIGKQHVERSFLGNDFKVVLDEGSVMFNKYTDKSIRAYLSETGMQELEDFYRFAQRKPATNCFGEALI